MHGEGNGFSGLEVPKNICALSLARCLVNKAHFLRIDPQTEYGSARGSIFLIDSPAGNSGESVSPRFRRFTS
jgi:hypothetical protein